MLSGKPGGKLPFSAVGGKEKFVHDMLLLLLLKSGKVVEVFTVVSMLVVVVDDVSFSGAVDEFDSFVVFAKTNVMSDEGDDDDDDSELKDKAKMTTIRSAVRIAELNMVNNEELILQKNEDLPKYRLLLSIGFSLVQEKGKTNRKHLSFF